MAASPYCLVWVPQNALLCAAVPVAPPSPSGGSSVASPESDLASSAAQTHKTTRRGGRGGTRRKEPPASSDDSTSASDGASTRQPAELHRRCDAWLAGLEQGGAAREAALEELRGSVAELSLNRHGCRVVQAALECGSRDQATALAQELRGSVRRTAKCPHGNYVLQKLLQHLPPSAWSFVVAELRAAAPELARHECACRVLCRLLEHGAALEPVTGLVAELLGAAPALRESRFGHHVLQTLLEHGSDLHRREVVAPMLGQLCVLAEHRNAAYVVEKALVFAALRERRLMALELLASDAAFLKFAGSLSGCRVAAALLRSPDARCSTRTRALIAAHVATLQWTKYGRRLLEEHSRIEGGDPSSTDGAG